MHKKTAFLVCAMAALMGFTHAHAQTASPHSDAGLFEIKSADGNYRLGFNALLQPALTFKHRKVEGEKSKNYLGFNINRARFGFHGNAFDPALTYLFQAEWDATGAGEGKTDFQETKLIDYSVNWAFSQEYFQIAAGKFVIPFARQQVMSPARYQFFRALESHQGLIPEPRDIGIMFHNGYHNAFEYAFAVMNQGLTARLAYNFNGIDGYDAVDFHGGDLRFALGVSFHVARQRLLYEKFDNLSGSADFILKAHGFSTNGVFYYRWDKIGEAPAKSIMGAGIDLGYLINDTIEPVLRYGWYKPSDKQSHEFLAGINHYVFGHNLKTQYYAGATLRGKKINPIIAGIQLQFAL